MSDDNMTAEEILEEIRQQRRIIGAYGDDLPDYLVPGDWEGSEYMLTRISNGPTWRFPFTHADDPHQCETKVSISCYEWFRLDEKTLEAGPYHREIGVAVAGDEHMPPAVARLVIEALQSATALIS